MTKCGGCGRFLTPTDGAKCAKCHGYYHKPCVSIPTEDTVPSDWFCPECKRKTVRKKKGDDTPVRGAQSEAKRDKVAVMGQAPTTGPTATAATSPDCAAVALEEAPRSKEFHLLMEEIKALRSDFRTFRRHMEIEVASIKVAVQTCNSRIDSLETRLLAMEGTSAALGSGGAESAESVVEGLRRELNERDQELLANDIEVSNIPEGNGENPTHLAMTIGTKLGIVLEERDIVSAERVGRRQLVATDPRGATERRPRILVVRLARRDLRDDFLKGARVRRGATTRDLDLDGAPRRFYVNERLTRANRQLFGRARDAAGRAGWRFVWTKRGQILVCRKPGEPTRRVRTEADLTAIFELSVSAGASPVRESIGCGGTTGRQDEAGSSSNFRQQETRVLGPPRSN